MDVYVEEVYHVPSVFAVEFYRIVHSIYLLKERKEGFFAPCPEHKNVIFKPGICPVLPIYPGINVTGFKASHKYVCIGARGLTAHGAALGLQEIFIVKREVVVV